MVVSERIGHAEFRVLPAHVLRNDGRDAAEQAVAFRTSGFFETA